MKIEQMDNFFLLIVIAYFLGSVPFGFLIGKAHGKDLRKIGSGNIGATNAARVLGKKWGYACFLLDVSKGLIPMLLVPAFGHANDQSDPVTLTLWLLVGCGAILGHIFPIFLGFKGGKGVATSLGIVLGLWPYYTLCGIAAFLIWIIVVLIWKYVSLASIAAAISFPIILAVSALLINSWQLSQLWPLITLSVLMSGLVILRHKANIKRLLEGSESKILQNKDQDKI